MELSMMIAKIEEFINKESKLKLIDIDKCDENEYWLLFEFNCEPCEWYNTEEDYCINYDEDRAPWCEAMENINIEVEELSERICENFDIEDCYESSEICNGMYIIL